MAYAIKLDPNITGITASQSRTTLDLNNQAPTGAIRVTNTGVDWGDAAITAYEAEQQQWGSGVAGYRVPNRTITIPLALGGNGSVAGLEETARTQLHQKVALIQREGGWLLRQRTGGPAMYCDVVNATLNEPDIYGEGAGVEPNVTLTLECLPDFYGDQVTLDSISATGFAESMLKLSGTQADIEGDHPARCEIQVSDTSGNNQNALLWGLRSRHYDSASTAKLFYQAGTSFTLLNGAVTGTLTGGYGTTVKIAAPITGVWEPIISTGQLTHQGSYRVWARCYSAADVPQYQLQWSTGQSAVYETNTPVQLPGAAAFYLLDLGEVRIDAPPDGASQWNGIISVYSAGGTSASVDCLFLQPLDEAAGLLQWNPQPAPGAISTESSPASGSNNSGSGTLPWSSPGKLNNGLSDSAFVNVTGPETASTEYLFASNFGFSVPTSGATIQGIQVQYFRKLAAAGTSGWCTDKTVQLLIGGSLSGSNLSAGAKWSTSSGWVTFGGPTNLWGLTPTATQVNASGFGVALQAKVSANSSQSGFVEVGFVKMTVYYALATGLTVTQDAVVYADSTAYVRFDGAWRNDPTNTVASPVSLVYGDLPRVPPSGMEGRAVEIFVKPSRGDTSSNPDAGVDGLTVTPLVRPCWLLRP